VEEERTGNSRLAVLVATRSSRTASPSPPTKQGCASEKILVNFQIKIKTLRLSLEKKKMIWGKSTCLLLAALALTDSRLVDENDVDVSVVLRVLRSQASRSYLRDSPQVQQIDPYNLAGALEEVAQHEAYVQEYLEVAIAKAGALVGGDFEDQIPRPGEGQRRGGGGKTRGEPKHKESASQRFDSEADIKASEVPQSRASKLANVENVRKKDSPTELKGILEQLRVQEIQKATVAARFWEGKSQIVLADTKQAGDIVKREIECGQRLYSENWYGDIVGCTAYTCRRHVEDDFASPEESDLLAAATEKAMSGLFHQVSSASHSSHAPSQPPRILCLALTPATTYTCYHLPRNPTFFSRRYNQGGTTSLVPDSRSASRLGMIGAQLADSLRERVRRSIMDEFGVETLYDR
jgi:hypothetical protein